MDTHNATSYTGPSDSISICFLLIPAAFTPCLLAHFDWDLT